MTNIVDINGNTINEIDDENFQLSLTQGSIVRALETVLCKAREGNFIAIAITGLKPGNIPYDMISVSAENVIPLAGAVTITLRRIQEAVVEGDDG